MGATRLPIAGWAVERAVLDVTPLLALADTVYAQAPNVPGWVPTASSAPLVPSAPVVDALRHALGPTLDAWPLFEPTQAWVRRQYPPHLAPPGHAPHSWHQDGALGHHFQGPGALLDTVTCWCPLVPCGVDAPGIELAQRTPELLPLEALRPVGPTHAPPLEPGDVLLMAGGVLHRTHVTPAMTGVRTSVELRFYAADVVLARIRR